MYPYPSNEAPKPENTTDKKPATQSRWRSKAAWLAVVAAVLLIGDTFGLWRALGVTSDMLRGSIDAIMVALAAFGIFNNPTNPNGY